MSVEDKKMIDGMAINEDGKSIRLLITDHLDWRNEYSHLLALQEKINSYILFYQDHQYNQVYENIKIEYAVFEIHFLFLPTSNALNFLEQVQRQLRESGIEIEYHISKGDDYEN